MIRTFIIASISAAIATGPAIADNQLRIGFLSTLSGGAGIFGKHQSDEKSPLDMSFAISIPATEALTGTRKKISYRVNGTTEQLMVRIPPKFQSGGKLRIRNKGHIQNEERGDLILSVNVDLKTSSTN